MATTDKEKIQMTTGPTTNERLTTILLILLIVLVSLVVIGIIFGFLMMSGMTLAPGASAGVDGWMMGR